MTFGRGVATIVGFVAAFALGVITAPYFTDEAAVATVTPSVSRAESPDAGAPGPRAAAPKRAAARAAAPAVAPAAAELQEQLRPLLNKGTDMAIAADGFRTAEQFAAVAHAARNTEVPFVLLKHRVLREGKTLEVAIRESKPDMNARVEARRAFAAARSDIARLAA
jgi:hypothetical protein